MQSRKKSNKNKKFNVHEALEVKIPRNLSCNGHAHRIINFHINFAKEFSQKIQLVTHYVCGLFQVFWIFESMVFDDFHISAEKVVCTK